jgi:RNA polymerase sigma-70 factor (ECF subfamily)
MGCTFDPQEVNGQPGAILRSPEGEVMAAWALDILDGQIQAIHSVNNPDKLGHLGSVADLNEIFRAKKQNRRPGAE